MDDVLFALDRERVAPAVIGVGCGIEDARAKEIFDPRDVPSWEDMEAQSVKIVAAVTEDEREIIPLMVAFNQSEGIVWRPEPMRAALGRLIREIDLGLVLLARDRASGAVVGYSLATFGFDLEFAGRDAFITELFVEPSVRRQGIGRALLDSIVEELRLRDVNAVHLMVRPENERARSLYEARGFSVVPRVMMTKRLVPGE